MPDLMVDLITSLDGYAAADGWPGLWGVDCPEYLAWLDEAPQKRGRILMGATTYRLMSSFAESGEEDVDQLTATPKLVFSSTLAEPLAWPNTVLVPGDPVAVVRELKATGGEPLRTLGSLRLCRALLRAGLVDVFRIGIFPFITGATGQERVYDDYPDLALDLITSRTFDGRIQMLEYAPTMLDRPPTG